MNVSETKLSNWVNGQSHKKPQTEATMCECVAALLEAEATEVAGAGTLPYTTTTPHHRYPTSPLP